MTTPATSAERATGKPGRARRAGLLSGLIVIACLAIPATSQAVQTNTWSGAGLTDVTITSDGTTNAVGFVEGGYCNCPTPTQWPGGNTYLFFVQTPSNVPLSERDGFPASENCQSSSFVECKIITSLTMTGGNGADTVRLRTSTGGPSVNLAATLGSGSDTAEVSGTGTRSVDGGSGTDLLKPSWIQAGTSPSEQAQAWNVDLQAGTASSAASANIAPTNFEDVDLRQTKSTPAGHVVKGTSDPNVIDTDSDTNGSDPYDEEGTDEVDGRGGDDTIHTYGLDDVITGGPGADTIDCGAGTDTVTDPGASDILTNCETEAGLVVNDLGDVADFDTTDGACDSDDGESGNQCTLRAAITEANAHAGPDDISFDVEPGGQQTIAPESALPAINDQVTIDGSTQPGAPAGEPGIFVDGAAISKSKRRRGLQGGMIRLAGSGSLLKSLGITSSPFSAALEVLGNGNTVQGVLIGIQDSFGQLRPNLLDGLLISGKDNVIGGTGPGQGNVISGNGRYGVNFSGGGARSNQLFGNIIGPPPNLNPFGGFISNEEAGVALTKGARQNTIGGMAPAQGNTIGNNGTGVLFSKAGGGNGLFSNGIGALPFTGSFADLSNSSQGLRITKTVAEDGAETEVALNTIANNGAEGISIKDSAGLEISGNAIGTTHNDPDCTDSLDNGGGGLDIAVENLPAKAPAHGKAVLAAGGLSIGGNAGLLNALGGNLLCIGDALDGMTMNLSGTLHTLAEVHGNVIRGGQGSLFERLRASFQQNVITGSSGPGIEMGKGALVELSQNSIFGNVGRPIDLFTKSGEPREPDPLDPDRGPNTLLNYPFLGFAAVTNTTLSLRLTLMMAKDARFRIEFFGANSCIFGQAEAEEYIASRVLETSRGGFKTAYVDLPEGAGTTYPYIGATATRIDGDDPVTSELSNCVPTIDGALPGWGITPKKLTLSHGKTSAVVDCVGPQACTGEAQVLDRESGQELGTEGVDVPAGDSATANIELSHEAQHALEQQGQLPVTLKATSGGVEATTNATLYDR